LRAYARFASIPRICLVCLNITQTCASPKKPKENPWPLVEKQMGHRHNSMFPELAHSEAAMIVINSNSNPDR
jgi:hypothetical protein